MEKYIYFAFVLIIVSGIMSLYFYSRVDISAHTLEQEPIPPKEMWDPSPTAKPSPTATKVPSDFVPLDIPLPDYLQVYAYSLCQYYKVDFAVVMAVMDVETGGKYDPYLKCANKNGTIDYGLMQINSCNHKWLEKELGISDFLDAHQNIEAGIFMLSRLYHQYGEYNKTLMAYNMGEYGASLQWEKGIETSSYSRVATKKACEFRKEKILGFGKEERR